MPVKHLPTGVVHKGYKVSITGCGFDMQANPDHWEDTTESITCEKNGCTN